MPEEETTQNSSADDAAQDDEKESDEESAEYEDLEQNQQESQNSGFSLTGVEAVAMLFCGAIFDIMRWFCLALDFALGMGEFISPFVNVLAAFIIGGWMYIRTGIATSSQKGKDLSKKLQQKLVRRLGASTLASLTPFLGAIFPIWTYTVYSELKHS